jgi:curved DNA-binding protein CbpA
VRPKKREATLYSLFGLPPGSTAEELHEAYLKLAFTLHPDRNGGADAGFSALTAAWAVLKDKARRRQYDLQLKLAGGQCSQCEGTGYAWRGRACLPCEGTGVAK